MARCEEHEKAKTAACRAEEEGGGSTAKSVEKKKRLEEEARNKVTAPPRFPQRSTHVAERTADICVDLEKK